MALTKNISAPIGAGVTKFVADLARADGRPVTIIAPAELGEQYRQHLPDARIVTLTDWLRQPVTNDLVIYCSQWQHLFWKKSARLHRAEIEVWTVGVPETEFRPTHTVTTLIRLPDQKLL